MKDELIRIHAEIENQVLDAELLGEHMKTARELLSLLGFVICQPLFCNMGQ